MFLTGDNCECRVRFRLKPPRNRIGDGFDFGNTACAWAVLWALPIFLSPLSSILCNSANVSFEKPAYKAPSFFIWRNTVYFHMGPFALSLYSSRYSKALCLYSDSISRLLIENLTAFL